MTQISDSAPEKQEIHLLDYWRTIWRGRWTVLSIFVVVVTLVAIATFTQTPIYRARATVEITPQSQQVAPLADVAQIGNSSFGWFAEERYFNTQYEILKSRAVSERVFSRLDLYNHPRFAESKDPVGSLAAMIQVEPVKETGIIAITMEGAAPAEVAEWVNAVAGEYVQRNLDNGVAMTTRAIELLLREVAPLREKLRSKQQAGFDLAAEERFFVPENEKQITGQRLLTLQADLTTTQVKRAGLASLLKQVATVERSGGSYESIPEIRNAKVIQELFKERAGLETEYQKLRVSYLDKHIRIQEKQSEIEQVNLKIDSEANRIISNFRMENVLLGEREKKLGRAIEKTNVDSMRADQEASSYELVQGSAVELRRIYDLINSRIEEIQLSTNLLTNNLKILDKAPIPQSPIKPRVALNLAMGILLGFILGIGTVFFRDYMDNTIRSSEDVEQFLKLSLLAVIPRQTDVSSRMVKEAYQTLRTSLLFSRKSKAENALLITSAGPQEGKSCTTVNIGRTIASSGEKVIILDCDLRRPTIHKLLSLDRDGGLTNFILSPEDDDWRNYVKASPQKGLFAMPSGPIPPNPADIFGRERFQNMLKEIKQEFDWVLIDSPPAMSLSDATLLSSLTDSVAFVIKHNENDKDLIRRCVTNMRRVNPNVVGAVLNNVDLGRSHSKDYYYLGYYYYGEPATSKKSSKKKGVASLTALDDDEGTINRSVG